MKRLAGCLVVCSLTGLALCLALWAGCRDDFGPDTVFAVGSGTGTDSSAGLDAIAIDDARVVLDVMVPVPDAHVEGGVPDASGSGSGDGGGSGSGDGDGSGSGDGGGARGDGGTGGGNPLRPGDSDPNNRTSFYACAGGPASTGVEVGLPIGLALAFAVRRRRRWQRS